MRAKPKGVSSNVYVIAFVIAPHWKRVVVVPGQIYTHYVKHLLEIEA